MADTKNDSKTSTETKGKTKIPEKPVDSTAKNADPGVSLGHMPVPPQRNGGGTRGYRGSDFPFDKLKLDGNPNYFEFDGDKIKESRVRSQGRRYVEHLEKDEGVPKEELPKFSIRRFKGEDGAEKLGCFRVQNSYEKKAADKPKSDGDDV